jgi:hypothetical protein
MKMVGVQNHTSSRGNAPHSGSSSCLGAALIAMGAVALLLNRCGQPVHWGIGVGLVGAGGVVTAAGFHTRRVPVTAEAATTVENRQQTPEAEETAEQNTLEAQVRELERDNGVLRRMSIRAHVQLLAKDRGETEEQIRELATRMLRTENIYHRQAAQRLNALLGPVRQISFATEVELVRLMEVQETLLRDYWLTIADLDREHNYRKQPIEVRIQALRHRLAQPSQLWQWDLLWVLEREGRLELAELQRQREVKVSERDRYAPTLVPHGNRRNRTPSGFNATIYGEAVAAIRRLNRRIQKLEQLLTPVA